jgi:hypothetical protein
MLFQCIDEVRHPVETVFHLLRDDMTSLVPYLSDVEAIEVLECKDLGDGKLNIINLWKGSSAKAPRMIQKFLTPDLISWKDHAVWHSEGTRHAEWRLEPKHGGSLFECTGTTRIEEKSPGVCQIRIDGDLRVYPERLPGVPRILAGKLRTRIESFVVAMVVPNLQTMATGVQAYFDDKASGRLETQ